MPFAEFLGNARIVASLQGMLAAGRVPHAMLFSGPRGLGKYTLARMFAQAANCERLTDDFCGECDTCRRIALLADPAPLVEQGLTERGANPDTATVERVPLILQTHPDVWAIVADPVRLTNPVARPVLHMGQLRAVQRAAYFKPVARRRVFILDAAETMRQDLAGVFLKILEEPPETSTLILLAPNPYQLLDTIRSRCMLFAFAPLEPAQIEAILRKRTELTAADRKLAAQFAEGSPGAAMQMDVREALELRRAALDVLSRGTESRGSTQLFAATAALVKNRPESFEIILEVFYSLLSDLLEMSSDAAQCVLRNPALRQELEALARRIDLAWVQGALAGLDQLHARQRRNINRQLGLDALAVSLARPNDRENFQRRP